MKTSYAKTKYVRISPRKARLVADLVRGMKANEAMDQLNQAPQKAGGLLFKTLKSAVSNAGIQHGVEPENLEVVEVRVDEGPRLKRGKARSRGSRSPILKRTSHFTFTVGEQGEL